MPGWTPTPEHPEDPWFDVSGADQQAWIPAQTSRGRPAPPAADLAAEEPPPSSPAAPPVYQPPATGRSYGAGAVAEPVAYHWTGSQRPPEAATYSGYSTPPQGPVAAAVPGAWGSPQLSGEGPAWPEPARAGGHSHRQPRQQPSPGGSGGTPDAPPQTTRQPGVAAAPARTGSPRRTGSPIISPGIQPALVTCALGLLIAATAHLARPAVAVAVALLQGVTAAGWFRLNGMWPARQGIALALLAGLTADVAMLVLSDEHAPAVMVATLGVWFLFTFVLQLRQRAGADERLYGFTVTVSATVVTVLAGGYLAGWSIAAPASGGVDDGSGWSTGAPVIIGGFAVAVAALVRALPLPPAVGSVGALAAAAASGVAVSQFTGVGAPAALLGFAAGGCALIGLRVASYDFPSRFVHFTAGVALPLTAAAPAVYLLGRVLAG